MSSCLLISDLLLSDLLLSDLLLSDLLLSDLLISGLLISDLLHFLRPNLELRPHSCGLESWVVRAFRVPVAREGSDRFGEDSQLLE